MLTVLFLRSDGHPVRTFASLPWVRVEGVLLSAGPDGQGIASHDGTNWSGDGFEAPKYVIHGLACTCRFECEKEGSSIDLGVVNQVDVVDGALYLPPGHRLIGHFNREKQMWYVYQENRFCSALVMEACPDSKR